MARQQYEGFTSLTFAALSGDVDGVRDLLRKGVDINSVNYDGRSAFAMVICKGGDINEIFNHEISHYRKLTIFSNLSGLLQW